MGTYRNLVFEGGGVKGIAYVGALGELESRGMLEDVERVAGTSAGSIVATLLALDYSVSEMWEILWSLEFRDFLDDSRGVVRDTGRLLSDFGWYKGDFFRAWMAELIGRKTGNPEITFEELEALRGEHGYCVLYVIGANLSTGRSEVFSATHSRRWSVADAVRISMSIPLFFAAERGAEGQVYVDGGLLQNYPVALFDESGSRNDKTLGLRLDSREKIEEFEGAAPETRRIDDIFEFTVALMKTMLSAHENQHLHSGDWARTIYIDTAGIGATDFDLTKAQKQTLVENGAAGGRHYFSRKSVDSSVRVRSSRSDFP